jgi:uncharacterized membrane protein
LTLGFQWQSGDSRERRIELNTKLVSSAFENTPITWNWSETTIDDGYLLSGLRKWTIVLSSLNMLTSSMSESGWTPNKKLVSYTSQTTI